MTSLSRNLLLTVTLVKKLYPLAILFILGCAAVAPPPGGPVDDIPPTLTAVEPPSGTVRISPGFTVQLTFSERLDENTDASFIRILPSLPEPPEVKLMKNVLEVTFPDKLAENQTYILTLTREMKDEHKVRLDQTYQLAFSTGDDISEGIISGKVYGGEGSAMVYLYNLSIINNDSLFAESPKYFTETDDSGVYVFSYLEPGDYRLLAFQGGRAPSPLIPSRMPYGTFWKDPVTLVGNPDSVNSINIRITSETPPLKLLEARMETNHRGYVRFTNPVELAKQEAINLSLKKRDEGVLERTLFQSEEDSRRISFYLTDVAAGDFLDLSLFGIRDSVDQLLEMTVRQFTVPSDTSNVLKLLSPIASKTIKVTETETLYLQFSDPVVLEPLDSALVLVDSSGVEVTPEVGWDDPARISVQPRAGWRPGEAYEIKLRGEFIRSPGGDVLSDSAVTISILAVEAPGTGTILGMVFGHFAENSIVTAQSVENASLSVSTDVNSDRGFTLLELPEGNWIMNVFQDKDGNGRYSYGKAMPFQTAEPFVVLPDTVEVRANWDNEGVDIHFPDN